MLLVVTDDMPFLVDTLRMVLDRRGLGIHLLVHPMLAVERDDKDALLDVRFDDGTGAPALDAAPGAHSLVEAWTQIELDRVDDEVGRQLERRDRVRGRGRPPGRDRLRRDAGPRSTASPAPGRC